MTRHATAESPATPDVRDTLAFPDPFRRTDPLDESWGMTVVQGGDLRAHEPADASGPRRRARLRAAALVLFVALSVLSAWCGVSSGGRWLWLYGSLVGGVGSALAVLWSRLPLSARGLRAVERAVFGLTAAYLSARQYQFMTEWASSGDEASVIWAVKTTMMGTVLLTFAYAMLIPNTWREAARVVVAIVAMPVATELLLFSTHPEALRIAWKFANWQRVTEDALTMALAAGLSVYGTHVISALRDEAFEVRQLNQYRLGRRLGAGGMAEVYLAEHRLLKRPCALKLIHARNANDPDFLTRFEREVRATAGLSHPNTVEIYDYGRTQDGTFFYVMEYLPGRNLDTLVKAHGPMTPGRVIYLLRQVCGALAEAHDAGLIHRDVKPANVFICLRGGCFDVAKLLDFGLVKASRLDGPGLESVEAGPEGMVRGTPLFMAPEQITGDRRVDHRCDLYALGGVAYAMLTGQPPFLGKDSTRVLTAQVCEPVFPPRQARPDIPEDLERVVLRCLAKSPEARFPDARSLDRALASCEAAGRWDAAEAARWWREHEPDAVEPLLHGLT